MLKLLKYDWKRNSTNFYATMSILIFVQILFLLGLTLWNWTVEFVFVFSILAFMAVGFILFFQVCKTYFQNLNSFNRRLLPVRPIQEIGSVVLLLLIYVVALIITIAVFMTMLMPNIGFIDSAYIQDNWIKPVPIISLLIYSLWGSAASLIWIMLAIAIARIFSFRRRIWIGIVALIVIQSIIGYIGSFLFGSETKNVIGYMEFNVIDIKGDAVPSFENINWFNPLSGPFIYEIITVAIALYAISYLMKKKIQL